MVIYTLQYDARYIQRQIKFISAWLNYVFHSTKKAVMAKIVLIAHEAWKTYVMININFYYFLIKRENWRYDSWTSTAFSNSNALKMAAHIQVFDYNLNKHHLTVWRDRSVYRERYGVVITSLLEFPSLSLRFRVTWHCTNIRLNNFRLHYKIPRVSLNHV